MRPHPVSSKYSADKNGNVYGSDKSKPLSSKVNADGYISHGFREKSQRETPIPVLAHIIVYECYNGMYDRTIYEIDHINSIKSDNRVENLQMLSRSDHKRKTHAADMTIAKRSGMSRSIPIIGYNLSSCGLIGQPQYFSGAQEAARQISGDASAITRCLKGKNSYHKGFVWKYAINETKNQDEIWVSLRDNRFKGMEFGNLDNIRKNNGIVFAGTLAGSYLNIQIKCKGFRVHSLICMAYHGFPLTSNHTVNHINRIRIDNRAENLR